MRIFITGATGFIASQIITDLRDAGHEIICCARHVSEIVSIFPDLKCVYCDFRKDHSADIWLERLQNVDVVINCVGILYHPHKKVIWDIHYNTPRALFEACLKAGVKKIIQISALGVDQNQVEYALSKKAADDYLLSLPITAIILRPSLVYGRGSYGGTSLFRGLAGLPWAIPIPGNGRQSFQPIHIEDLSKAVLSLVTQTELKSQVFDAVSSNQVSLTEILTSLRRWLGFGKAILIKIPLFFIRLGGLLGDFIPYSSLNTSAYKMLSRDNISNPTRAQTFHQQVGFVPRDFKTGVYNQPSTVQDHWHARLFFLKPMLQLSIGFMWLYTALCSVFLYPIEESKHLLGILGIQGIWQSLTLYAACLLDACIGLAVILGWQLKKIGFLQILVIVLYTGIITWKLPYLWIDPFAPIAKNIPLLVAILIYIGIGSDR